MISFVTGKGVNVTKIDAPNIVDPRKEKLTLKCEYDLGNHELYSINWYKNDNPIFRYMPNSDPSGSIFNNNFNVNVSLKESNSKQLVLYGSSDFRKSKYIYYLNKKTNILIYNTICKLQIRKLMKVLIFVRYQVKHLSQ